MKILLTGASSFTGAWFAHALAQRGHEVHAILQCPSYEGVRKERVEGLRSVCAFHRCSFGDERWFQILNEHSFDLFCHHAAEARGYKSPEFDCIGAVASNTRGLPKTLRKLQEQGCNAVLLTRSIFEMQDSEIPFSPYALSKKLTTQCFRHYAAAQEMKLKEFVIPNPFGPWEEERFTHYLMQRWFKKDPPLIVTPRYVRDNIHIQMLARAYAAFADDDRLLVRPSCYAESQLNFALRLGVQMKKRIPKLELSYTEQFQRSFPEPLILVNADPVLLDEEPLYWDQLAEYYQRLFA